MRKIAFLLILALIVLFPVRALADGEPPAEESVTEQVSDTEHSAEVAALLEEISALQEKIEELGYLIKIGQLEDLVQDLQLALDQEILIGVMPIEGASKIPEVGNSFREVIISSLQEFGIPAVESLDDETLSWVRRQTQLTQEGLINPLTAPPEGELYGVPYYLMGTVTRYETTDTDKIYALGGILEITLGGGAQIRKGSLVVDFRLVDARTGVVIDAFQTVSNVKRIDGGGAIIGGLFGGGSYSEKPLPEKAARDCARQAARQIAVLLGIELPEEEFLMEENKNPYRD